MINCVNYLVMFTLLRHQYGFLFPISSGGKNQFSPSADTHESSLPYLLNSRCELLSIIGKKWIWRQIVTSQTTQTHVANRISY